MAINFPNTPTNGEEYTNGLVTYTWNGTFWQSNGLSGAKGDKGEVGQKGDKGDSVKGDQGQKGELGEKGIPGTAAAKGDKGDKGFVGTQGSKGDKGERVTVWKGSAAPVDTELLWYNTIDGNFLVYYNDGDTPYWVDASPTVAGDKGQKGDKGDTVLTLENATLSNTLTANIALLTTANVTTANIATANVATLTAVNATISGNLTVSGTTTYINTAQLNVGDNVVVLNADLTSMTAPTENAGISVNRGSAANVELIWDESADRWSIGSYDLAGNNFTGTSNNALFLGGTAANAYALKASPTFTGTVIIPTLSANGSVGTNGQVLTSNGTIVYWATPQVGLAEVDSWYLTSTISNSSTGYSIIGTNWSRQAAPFAHVGTGMTQSSGIFTFPSAGRWEINFMVFAYYQFGGAYSQIEYTTNNGSNWLAAAYSKAWQNNTEATYALSAIVNITNPANDKVRFGSSGNIYGGSASTFATFKKLA